LRGRRFFDGSRQSIEALWRLTTSQLGANVGRAGDCPESRAGRLRKDLHPHLSYRLAHCFRQCANRLRPTPLLTLRRGQFCFFAKRLLTPRSFQ
jgi:hypothetical protein